MTLSNCDSNESANCEPGESEDSDGQTHPDVTSVIGPVPVHIPLKFYYRKYMLRKKADIVPVLQKKCLWQATTIIQPGLRHLGTSHF